MPGADARGIPANGRLCEKLGALRGALEGIKAEIDEIANEDAIYGLLPVRAAIIEREQGWPPVGWSCQPKAPWSLHVLHSLEASEIRSAIEDLEKRIELIQLIVGGTAG